MSKTAQLNILKQTRIIAVLRRVPKEQLFSLVSTLVASGINVLEITVDSEDAYQSIQDLNNHFGDRALVGAGTVVTSDEAESALEAGAQFIFSPSFDPDVVQLTNDANRISIPGVFTPTEIVKAEQAGADAVKIFPASALGPRFIKDIQGPLGHIPMIPTGGINIDNTASYLDQGAIAVGVGGSLINTDWSLATLEVKAKAFVTEVQKSRGA